MIQSIAIGSFDGIHLAHQALINKADAVLIIERFSATLTPGWKRTFFIHKPCFFYPFENIKNLTPKEFIKKLQNDFPALKEIIIGYDFIFGKNKSGNIQTLQENFYGKVTVIKEITLDGISIHSRVIRKLLQENNIALANKLLSRYYQIDGYPIKGLGLGSKKLVPTINLRVQDYLLPIGVFATFTKIQNISYPSITFIGKRATIDNSFSIETHLLKNFNQTPNSFKPIFIQFVSFLRDNKKFSTIKDLKKAIYQDITKAKKLLSIQ